MSRIDFHLPAIPCGVPIANNMVPNLFTKDLVRHLVGETSQNTIDAWLSQRSGERARLVFHLTSVARAAIEPYGLSTAEMHAEACDEEDIGGRIDGDVIPVLNIEDWSGGLGGDVSAGNYDITSPLGRYLFAIGTGVAGKSGGDNGRHGIGSGIAAAISKIRCMYFYSRRQDGTSVASARLSLATHSIDGRQYSSEARLGLLDETGNWQGVLEGNDADAMARAFGYKRDDADAGLSCSIIDPVESVTGYSIVAAILGFQFVQISRGEIEFHVIDDSRGIDVTINAENIDDLIASEFFAELQNEIRQKGRKSLVQCILEDLKDILGFVRSFQGKEDLPVVDLNDPQSLPPDMKRAWHEGRIVAVSCPVEACHNERGKVDGTIGVLLKKPSENKQGYDIVVRDSIVNIQKVSGRLSYTASYGDGISVLFGDSEDPSHTSFKEMQARKRGWRDCREQIRLFKAAGELLHRAVSLNGDEGDRFSLAKFFPMPGKDLSALIDGGVAGDETDDDGDTVVEPGNGTSSMVLYRIDRNKGSLVCTLSKEAKELCDEEQVDIEVSFEYVGSKPGRGSFADTQGSFWVERGAESFSSNGNVLTLSGVSPDLRFHVLGVDLNRDMKFVQNRVEEDMENAA